MADQNLHDIKIDELDSPKKTSLKNILTLVALLFIIFAISVVITQLILNTDDNSTIESNTSTTTIDNVSETNSSTETKTDDKEELNSSVPTLNFKDRNITTAIKPPLTNK
ncbi:MAG TPA: hypothetical protein ENK82_03395, partial [Campylobacterales bacterium]|nr:hypothetical protein [Campylobacterales bacterium]